MGKNASTKTPATPKPKKYTVTIEAIAPVAFAVPGIRKVQTGDSITFGPLLFIPSSATLPAKIRTLSANLPRPAALLLYL